MKEVIRIESAEGSYFETWKNEDGYFLKNLYTEIPNEFHFYHADAAKNIFEGLRERIPECKEVRTPSGHPNSCMYVVYSDGSKTLFQMQDGVGKNLCAYTCKAAFFSEFFPGWLHRSELLTLDHLRQVCREKKEDFGTFVHVVKDLVEDDGIDVFLDRPQNGKIIISENVLGMKRPFITIFPDGQIDETGNLLYAELLKQQKVEIIKEKRSNWT